MQVVDAQLDMRYAYFSGAPGVLASALVWLAAGVVSLVGPPLASILTLFFGGMMIHPIAMLLAKLLGRPGSHRAGNPLAPLAIEATFVLFCGLPLAYMASLVRVDLFFPAMLLVIGARYLVFHTLYGLRIYWLCGGVLALAGFLLAVQNAPSTVTAFAGAGIELIFAVVLFARARGDQFSPSASQLAA